MTYCLALYCDDGIVFASDSRTNAGVDYMTTFRKMHVRTGHERVFVMLAAGSLATTQEVLTRIDHDIEIGADVSLDTVEHLWEAADYLGRINLHVQDRHREALKRDKVNGEASFIIGGQVGDEPHGIRLVYPQGNGMTAGPKTPYLQIGETKYGKPILDRLSSTSLTLPAAARLALVSLDATVRSNVTVGPPFEVAMVPAGSHAVARRDEFAVDDPYLAELHQIWQTRMVAMFQSLPPFGWE